MFVRLICTTFLFSLLAACQAGSKSDAAVIAVAKAGYDAFATGDMEAWAATQSADVKWEMPKGFPYGGNYVGPQQVIEEVFGPIGALWPDFKVEPIAFHASGNVVFIETKMTAGGQVSDSIHKAVINDGLYTEFQVFDDAGFMMVHATGAEGIGIQFFADEDLRIIDEGKSFVAALPSGESITITRQMTPCAKNKGWLQPLVPEPGIVPVTEIEVLNAIGDPNTILVDMRTEEWFLDATIPGSVNIPYTEVAMRMDELGCKKGDGGWDCSDAANVVGFCNGPVCPQSPTAMRAMIRDGFPAEKIHYYRGGMLDWDALGLTTVEGDFAF